MIGRIGEIWRRYLMSTDPKQFWEKVSCPVLALNSDKDLQVNRDQNLSAIEKYLAESGNNKSVIIKTLPFPSLDHLFKLPRLGASWNTDN
jgi:fermentation-respiration switch protein FrsA (DUF1100 family)